MTATEDGAQKASDPHTLALDTGSGQFDGAETPSTQSLVTAVVTTYDRPESAKRAITSVVEQTYAPLECIVVEDGTDTGVHRWIREAGHDEVRYVRHAENQGLAGSRNTALALAGGDYVAFLDDDDVWKPDRIERQMTLLKSLSAPERRKVAVVYCGVESRHGEKVQSILHPENDGDLANSIRERGASTVQSACLFRKTALLDVGGYDESLPSSIDHDIWMALATGGYEVRALDEPLVVSDTEFAASMMTDTNNRIDGVSMYVDKWLPTYREWFGPTRGDRYAQRYFARAVARLAATKFVTGQFGQAARALRAILEEANCREYGYVAYCCGILCAELAVKRFFPPSVVRTLASLRE